MNNGGYVVYLFEEREGRWYTESYGLTSPAQKLGVVWLDNVDFSFLDWFYGDDQENGYQKTPYLEIRFWTEHGQEEV